MSKINVRRGLAPDEDNGGTMVDGVLVGPRKPVTFWQIDEEPKRYHERSEAEKEMKRRELYSDLHDVLGQPPARSLKVSEVVALLVNKGGDIKSILQTPRYQTFIKKEKV